MALNCVPSFAAVFSQSSLNKNLNIQLRFGFLLFLNTQTFLALDSYLHI